MEAYEKALYTLSSSAILKHQNDITLKDVVTDPQEILALFASQKQQEKGMYRRRTLCYLIAVHVRLFILGFFQIFLLYKK